MSTNERDVRQVARQIRLFLEDGERERLNVCLALLEPDGDGVCHDPQHDCVDDCPMCGVTALRERVAAAALAVMVGSPHIAKAKVSKIAWDVAGSVVDRVFGSGGGR